MVKVFKRKNGVLQHWTVDWVHEPWLIPCSLQEARRRPVPRGHLVLTLSTSQHVISFHFQHNSSTASHTPTTTRRSCLHVRARNENFTSKSNRSIKPRRPNNMGNCFGSCPEEKEKQPQSPAPKPAGTHVTYAPWPIALLPLLQSIFFSGSKLPRESSN